MFVVASINIAYDEKRYERNQADIHDEPKRVALLEAAGKCPGGKGNCEENYVGDPHSRPRPSSGRPHQPDESTDQAEDRFKQQFHFF